MKTGVKLLLALIAGGLCLGISIGITHSYTEYYDVGWESWKVDAKLNDSGELTIHEVRELNSEHGCTIEQYLKPIKRDGHVLTPKLKDNKITISMYAIGNDNSKTYYATNGPVVASKTGTNYFSQNHSLIDVTFFPDSFKVYTNLDEKVPKNFFIDMEYTVENVVAKYDDYSYFNWKFAYGDEESDAKNVSLNLTIPSNNYRVETTKFAEDKITFLGAGINYGKYDEPIYTSSNYKLSSKALFANDGNQDNMEVLLVIPNEKDIFPNIKNESNGLYSGENGKDEIENGITKVLKQRASFAKKVKIFHGIEIFGCGALSLASLVAIAYIYLNYDKERKPSFDGDTYRELPASYGPALAVYLMEEGKVNQDALNAQTMDLIRRNYIMIDTERADLSQKHPNYVMVRNNNIDDDDLSKSERYLLSWYFDDIANGKDELSFDEIEKYMKNAKNAEVYNNSNGEWIKLVKEEADAHEFFDDMSGLKKVGAYIILFTLLSIVIVILGVRFRLDVLSHIIGASAVGLTLFLMMYTQDIKRKSEKAIEDYARWKAFKQFLKTYSKYDECSILEADVMQEYMVYAVAFDMADTVEKELKLKLNKVGKPHYYDAYPYFYYHYWYHCCYHMDHARVTGHQAIAAASAKSSSHSGGGFGGGSFGGGGGGHSSFH